MGILEKIAEIEKEIGRTQKNKGTIYIYIYIYICCTLLLLLDIVRSFFLHLLVLLCSINLATEYHLGVLKAKLARYRAELLEPDKGAGAGKVKFFCWTFRNASLIFPIQNVFYYSFLYYKTFGQFIKRYNVHLYRVKVLTS